ncbi:MAG: peptide deformylase [Clostridia bacterium]|nr:peptide deformylase [Clostridia bacterium]
MAIRDIVIKGEPILRKKCRPVENFDNRLWLLLDDMRDTLIDSNGVGLAAPQVGIMRRIVIIDTGEQYVEMINPEITFTDGEQTGLEGCLSIPGKYGIVTRPNHVKAKYQDRMGNWCEIDGTELTARAICHECDHLEGRLYIDVADRMLTDEELSRLERQEGDS